jgi:hypothetical protein
MLDRSTLGSAAVAATAALSLMLSGARAHDESKYPDWSGQWRRIPSPGLNGGQPRYDPSKPVGRGQEPPLKEEYRRIHEASMADQAAGGSGLYISSAKCIPMGMPYTMSIVFPFEFVFTAKTTFILFEPTTSHPRRIYTDGRDWPMNEDPTFPGTSIGKWIDEDGDGRYDTLEIETRNMRVPRTYDQSGIPFHEDGQGIIKERIYLDKANPNLLHNEMTTTDNALTRPWTVMKNYERLPKVIWTENNYTEGNDHIVIGKEEYLLGGDGNLMPLKKDQPPPDLRHFNVRK